MDDRLPAHLEVSALIRAAQAQGGFAAVLKKGHPIAGTILLVLAHNGTNARAFERMPQLDGTRTWEVAKTEVTENKQEFLECIDRRGRQDGDLWVVELDVADGERLIGLPGTID
jgi:hypothetical protein